MSQDDFPIELILDSIEAIMAPDKSQPKVMYVICAASYLLHFTNHFLDFLILVGSV